MGKQHDTFPEEKPEMAVPKETPEFNQPSDPGSREVPKEYPQIQPDELPAKENPLAEPWESPGTT
jgi:hypothetical protein